MKKPLFLLPFIILLSCQPDKERILGHWHSISTSIFPDIETFDFMDSTYVQGKNNFAQSYEGRYFINNDSILAWEHSANYEFKGDTLIWGAWKLIRVNSNSKDSIEDFLRSLKVIVELQFSENTISIKQIDNITGNISFGKCWNKSSYFKKCIEDSFYIQINHKIANITEVNSFLDALEEAHEDEDSQRSIMLTIDKDAPQWMIDSTKNMIRRRKIINKIYKTCIDKRTGSIGLVELKD